MRPSVHWRWALAPAPHRTTAPHTKWGGQPKRSSSSNNGAAGQSLLDGPYPAHPQPAPRSFASKYPRGGPLVSLEPPLAIHLELQARHAKAGDGRPPPRLVDGHGLHVKGEDGGARCKER